MLIQIYGSPFLPLSNCSFLLHNSYLFFLATASLHITILKKLIIVRKSQNCVNCRKLAITSLYDAIPTFLVIQTFLGIVRYKRVVVNYKGQFWGKRDCFLTIANLYLTILTISLNWEFISHKFDYFQTLFFHKVRIVI